MFLTVAGGFSGFSLPRKCQGYATSPLVLFCPNLPHRQPVEGEPKDCPLDPYVIVHDKSVFVDQQLIKLQEAPDSVPVGELPRHIQLCADRYEASCCSQKYMINVALQLSHWQSHPWL